MRTIKKQTDFYTVFTETTVIETSVLNNKKVFDTIDEYVNNHLISNRQFKLSEIDIHQYPQRLTVKLIDTETGDEPDEDMYYDNVFNKFLKDLAEKCNCNYISLPSYYYGK